MSEQQELPPEEPSESTDAQEQTLADLMDRYVESLQSGDQLTRSQLLQRHPELNDIAACLDDLEQLAPVSIDSVRFDSATSDAVAATVEYRQTPDGSPEGAGPVNTGPAIVGPATPLGGTSGQDFGKYQLIEEIGRGGMGVVYKARQVDLDRIVAIKMILSSWLASAEEVRRFYTEAKAAGRLRHPHIVGIHEVGQIHGQHYFAMDCVDGPSLEDVLRKGPCTVPNPNDATDAVADFAISRLTSETAAKCLVAVARAVDYLHTQNIVHRDLKPANILFDRDGNPQVTDFGLAKIFETDNQQTQTGTIVGTPCYMSPEQAAGHPSSVSPQSDIYSLGAILYEMLTGRPPFKEDNPLDTLMQVLESEPAMPSTLNPVVPRELEMICMRCLEKEPRSRYGSAKALADDLDRYLKGEAVEARPSDVWQKVRRWVRREPAFVSRLTGLLAAASILQFNYIRHGTDWPFHVRVMSVLGIWVIVSFLFQRLLNRDRFTNPTRFAWAAADTTLLTALLYMADGPRGPLLIGYPMLVAASGLFFRVRLVWFMTLISLIAYAVLLKLRPEEIDQTHYPVIFAAVLAVMGFIVAYQVYRIRILSRYFESRRRP